LEHPLLADGRVGFDAQPRLAQRRERLDAQQPPQRPDRRAAWLTAAAKPRFSALAMNTTSGAARAAACAAPSLDALSTRITSRSRTVWAASAARQSPSSGPL
jgi:hypothetical protein